MDNKKDLKWRVLEVIYQKQTRIISTIISFVLLITTIIFSLFFGDILANVSFIVTFSYMALIDKLIFSIIRYPINVAYKNHFYIILFTNSEFWRLVCFMVAYTTSLLFNSLSVRIFLFIASYFICCFIIIPRIVNFFALRIKD